MSSVPQDSGQSGCSLPKSAQLSLDLRGDDSGYRPAIQFSWVYRPEGLILAYGNHARDWIQASLKQYKVQDQGHFRQAR